MPTLALAWSKAFFAAACRSCFCNGTMQVAIKPPHAGSLKATALFSVVESLQNIDMRTAGGFFVLCASSEPTEPKGNAKGRHRV